MTHPWLPSQPDNNRDALPWPIGVALVVALLVGMCATAEGATCVGAAPAPGWVCVGGGWLPPDHPHAQGTPGQAGAAGGGSQSPQPGYAPLARGASIQPGEYLIFQPPFVITPHTDPATYRGKILRPSSSTYSGPLVILENFDRLKFANRVIDYPPMRLVVADLWIHAYPGQTCVQWQGVAITLKRPQIIGCRTGIVVEWAVNGAIEEGLIHDATTGLHLKGNGPASFTAPHSITSLTISRLRIANSASEAVRIGHALGVVFSGVVLEGNPGAAVRVVPTWSGAAIKSVVLRDVWFEANGAGVLDPYGVVRAEGVTGTW